MKSVYLHAAILENFKMAKVHIGLVAENKNLENEIQEAAKQFGGSYVHHSRNILELSQKLALQKVQLILMVLPAKGEGSEIGPIYQFIRNKRDLQNIPICLLTETPLLHVAFLLNDESVRAFPLEGGVFMALLCMSPLLQSNRPPEGAVGEEWVQMEFLQCLKSKVGQEIQFEVRTATDDEMHAPFFCQQSEEIRTHLGWFKFTARLLESDADGLAEIFKGMSRDMMEEVAQNLIAQVVEEFRTKVTEDLGARGAVYLPEVDQLAPADRKWVYSNARHNGILFSAPQCQVLLQISRYI